METNVCVLETGLRMESESGSGECISATTTLIVKEEEGTKAASKKRKVLGKELDRGQYSEMISAGARQLMISGAACKSKLKKQSAANRKRSSPEPASMPKFYGLPANKKRKQSIVAVWLYEPKLSHLCRKWHMGQMKASKEELKSLVPKGISFVHPRTSWWEDGILEVLLDADIAVPVIQWLQKNFCIGRPEYYEEEGFRKSDREIEAVVEKAIGIHCFVIAIGVVLRNTGEEENISKRKFLNGRDLVTVKRFVDYLRREG
eukprot:Gregarina_sp_Poly_1__5113@NODE_2706_length_1801_cov_57_787197_g1692_i1_p1_GENE_NODE_2706_length_1801_cov_57_787197_g1692_i1NODE_2706_length_1801_cov_57_787197_g1692_i1_p1_ORF_typecomplete_len261_score32_17_NODE_2706_length_1801_cov_57_787197_g1692_i14911273